MKRSLGAQTFLGVHPAVLIGTYDEERRPNVATVSWTGICCSRPPCVAVSLRAATKTHGCLKARGAFTVNVPDERHVAFVDLAGTWSGREADKFAMGGLTAAASERVDAPYVAELPLVLACRLREAHELGLHTLFVGEIVDVLADEEILGPNGLPDVERLRPLTWASGNGAYYGVGARLAPSFVRRTRKGQ